MNQEDSTMTSDLCARRSMAVQMEDYEVYYRKQKADSNCGFAEEFEVKPRLKPHSATSMSNICSIIILFLFCFISNLKGPEACWHGSAKSRRPDLGE